MLLQEVEKHMEVSIWPVRLLDIVLEDLQTKYETSSSLYSEGIYL
jgi:hypothetical protein